MKRLVKDDFRQLALDNSYLFYDKGLSPTRDSGDLSIRDPETGLIYISPRPDKNFRIHNWRSIDIDDIVVMDIDGNIIETGAGRFPTVEAPMHLAIYKARPEIHAIIHSHALYTGVFAALGWGLPTILVETTLFTKGEIPCAKFAPVASQELADNVVEALGKDGLAAIMAQHGAVYIGKNIDEAFVNAEYAERVAQTMIYIKAMGEEPLKLDMSFEKMLDKSIMDISDEI